MKNHTELRSTVFDPVNDSNFYGDEDHNVAQRDDGGGLTGNPESQPVGTTSNPKTRSSLLKAPTRIRNIP